MAAAFFVGLAACRGREPTAVDASARVPTAPLVSEAGGAEVGAVGAAPMDAGSDRSDARRRSISDAATAPSTRGSQVRPDAQPASDAGATRSAGARKPPAGAVADAGTGPRAAVRPARPDAGALATRPATPSSSPVTSARDAGVSSVRDAGTVPRSRPTTATAPPAKSPDAGAKVAAAKPDAGAKVAAAKPGGGGKAVALGPVPPPGAPAPLPKLPPEADGGAPLPKAAAGERPTADRRGETSGAPAPAPSRDGGVAAREVDAGRRPDAPPIVVEAEGASGPTPSDLLGIPKRGVKRAPPPGPPPLPIPGGPLNIPGTNIDLRARRVERFLDEGGTALAGTLMDSEGAKPVANAQIEAWMGTRSIHAMSDGDGRFAFEGLEPGSRITLWITASPTYVQERTEFVVPKERPQVSATFKMLPRAAVSGAQDGGIGVFLARRGNRTIVSGLVAFGAAERAGLRTGDALLAIGKRGITELGPGAIEYLLRGPIGSDVALTVQSPSEPARTVTVKRTAR